MLIKLFDINLGKLAKNNIKPGSKINLQRLGSLSKDICSFTKKGTKAAKTPVEEFSKKAGAVWQGVLNKLPSSIKSANLIGHGGEARVYKITGNKDYVLRLACSTKDVTPSKFKAVEDIFEGRNFGQPVARNGYATINKRVPGKPLYKVNAVLNNKMYNPKSYIRILKKYVNLPDKTLEDFVENVAFINKKGFRIDETNPENFLYNAKTGKIGIIDIERKNSSSLSLYEPYAHTWILDPLVNGHDLPGIYKKLKPKQRKEVFELITKLEDRISPLCKKHGIPKADWNQEDYMLDSLASILHMKNDIDYNNDDLCKQVVIKLFPGLRKRLGL